MREAAADGKSLGTLFENDQRLIAVVAIDARDRAQVDDRAAMDLPEELRVELIEELLDRLADQRFSVRGDHLGVLVFGVEVENVVDRDQAHRRPERGLDPLQWAAGVARLDLGEYGGEIGGRPLEALLEPFDDLDDPVGSHWLEHVVDRALLERGHRILVVGGDEDDVTSAGQRFGDLEPRLERHANVEKYDIGLELALQRQGLLAILGLGDDGEPGPRLRASSRIVPPSACGSSPCLTAFSTIDINNIGGKRCARSS